MTGRDRRTYRSLGPADLETLAALLRNEADMAYRRRTPILLDYLELEDGDRVLDCGCGMGFQLMAMAALRRLRLTGLDPDPDRLARARAEGIDADLVPGDATELPFPDGAFDKVLLTEVLEHVPDDRRALAEIHRVLAPGGLLAISVPNARWPFWWDPINRLWIAAGGRPIRGATIAGIWSLHERLYTREALEALVREAGFDVEAVEETTHYAFPFSHFLVYSVGKPLLERGLLPDALARSADRFRGRENRGTLVNPVNGARAILQLVDRLNDTARARRQRTHVNVLLKARKPGV